MQPQHNSPDNLIQCACGCGQWRSHYDGDGRPRYYVHGHNGRGKPHAYDAWGSRRRYSPQERFWGKVQKTASCWLWSGSLNGGYGTIKGAKGIVYRAHRLSYEIHYGPIPDGLCVCHHCDNPRCVNPAHLFVGTRADNMADCAAKHRLPRGRTPSAKITREQAESIRQRYKEGGVTQKALADEFGLAQTSIFEIIKGQRWNWKGGDALCSVVQAIVTM